MTRTKLSLAVLLASCMLSSTGAAAQGLPKLPRIPKIEMPKVPKVPQVPASIPTPLPDGVSIPGQFEGGANVPSGDLTEQYMADAMVVAQGTSIAGNSAANDKRLDKEIAVYRAAVDRLGSGRYASVPEQMRNSLNTQMMRYFDQRTSRVDADIAFINGKVAENSGYDDRIGTRVYNGLISLESEMYAANLLFPGRAGYSAARAKVNAMVEKFGSRGDQANGALDEIGAENAAKVQMPAAAVRDTKVEGMFRRAFATGGIKHIIKKINIRSGWRDKREYGRVVGQLRDAAIGTKNTLTGKCYVIEFTMFRDTSGAVSRNSHTATRIACENIK